uniref:ATP synthase subunit a n=1 Tax=Lycorma delicatula TaxID=130591 RepID=A0A7U3QJN3_LYCDL|nr:ATP synthase F0 subunit 6 [Lycorma delicatula]QPN49467.1 ATP synthase F0 subunit 6 [Lycorma delicatula]QPN49480.1 ATP synthase F0 subunit 6 [Lycorma delicatula]QPN49493.1 ATP synthase F0 subunit 6 [Lycorma delicatula]QPN49506.1 ATP synthase F0 subunit 6 [Lycorma delicatula]
MMTSLFSTFDPMTKLLQSNWIIMMMTTMILPKWYWTKKSRMNMMMKMMEKKLMNEFKLMTHQKEILIMVMSIFMFIMISNMMGLIPYVFTSTSHLVVSMSIALPMWIMITIYSWKNFTNEMFKHMLPKGTPSAISPMMIMIETTGNLIRPISLAVRLTANMIAGHLLMTLLGNTSSIKMLVFIMPIQMTLTAFETAISMIQAYVFATLVTLYSSEVP